MEKIHQILLSPKGLRFTCRSGETITEAAEQVGIRLPLSCRNGVCELCECQFKAGASRNRRTGEIVSGEGQVSLLCNLLPDSDCEFYIEDVLAPGEMRLKTYNCQIESVTAFNHDVYQVVLQLPAGVKQDFYAGQYLSLNLPDKDPAFFSIASAPAPGSRALELHIQAAPGWDSAMAVIAYLQRHQTISVTLPYGKACLQSQPELPVILIAAGTGFAQMKSIIEFVCQHNPSHPVALYWGVRKREDLYALSLTEQWQQDYPGFKLVTVVGDVDDNEWPGHHQQLFDAVIGAEHDLAKDMVLASGSPAMVYATMDALVAAGLPVDNFYSDVLEYAPR